MVHGGGGDFKLYRYSIFQCMGQIFRVDLQRYALKFHTKYLTKNWNMCILFRREQLTSVFENPLILRLAAVIAYAIG